ncbi:MAG: serine kinase [Bacteroidetes bacterium]|nr:serine kinase [Bacteroidota bacterium]
MKVIEIQDALNLKVLGGEEGLQKDILGGYTSDLLSDVMGHAEQGYIWITLQTHKNVMAVASLKELAAVVLIKNNVPDEDMLEQANEEGIPVLVTNLSAFDISGKLFNLLTK